MEHPTQLFARIRQRKSRPGLKDSAAPARQVAPAPASIPAPTPSAPPPREATPTPAAPPAQRHTGHALYRQVMRSHDRMGTRHL